MKISPEAAREIRRLYRTSRLTQAQIAQQFGTSQPHVSRLVRGVRRDHPADDRASSWPWRAKALSLDSGRIVRVDAETGEESEVDVRHFKEALRPFSLDPAEALEALQEGATVKTAVAFYELRTDKGLESR